VINGNPLHERFEERDYITHLLHTPGKGYIAAIHELQFLPIPEEFQPWWDKLYEGRQALYVCPECGDLGCGAISAVVTREGGYFVWKDFAYYNSINYSNQDPNAPYSPTISPEGYEDIGPFIFEAGSYSKTLQSALELIKDQPVHR
jgi:hypothetical protein